MPAVHLSHLTFAYSASVPLIEDVTAHLGPGWTGVIGANGAGKTTLLSLIAGSLTPDAGTVTIDPPGSRPVTCPQTVGDISADVRAFAASEAGAARRLHGRLALDERQLDRWDTLSPGERKRWQIGAALAAAPDIFILDEPTNHLDVEARNLLLDTLRRFTGVGLVVSHDRHFLDRLTRVTLRFDRGAITLWSGNYQTASAAWEEAEREMAESYRAAKREQRKLTRRVADQRRAREAAAARTRRDRRNASIADHDARGMTRKNRAEAGERVAGRRLEITRAQLGRAAERLAGFDLTKSKGRDLFFDYRPAPKEWLIRLDRDGIRAGDITILRDVHLGVRRSDRIRVAGRNGAGKTTLLNALAGAATVPADRVVHLDQEARPTAGAALLANVRALRPADRTRVLSLVAALGVDPEPLLASEAPSPGEARKLKMAYGLGTQAWMVVLDEPTNHLDLPAISRLEAALTSYPGALLMVTHDDALAAACTDTTWLVADGTVTVPA